MNKNTYIVFEFLSLKSLLSLLIRNTRSIHTIKNSCLYFIDQSKLIRILTQYKILRFLSLETVRLDFRLIDIKDDNGELLRTRIYRHDLFHLIHYIINNKAYTNLFHNHSGALRDFQIKGIIDGHIMDPYSIPRLLLLINLVNFKSQSDSTLLIYRSRGWSKALRHYASIYNVNLFETSNILDINYLLKKAKYRLNIFNSNLFLILRNIKHFNLKSILNEFNSTPTRTNQILFQGRGDIRLINDGYHSDFFWILNSSFQQEGLTYICSDRKERLYLLNSKINICNNYLNLKSLLYRDIKVNTLLPLQGPDASSAILLAKEFNCTYRYWLNLFINNNIKVFVNWYIFDRFHYAQNHAIRKLGGISVYLPISFIGFPSIDSRCKFDISFCMSRFGSEVENNSLSKIKYQIVTGYPRDYSVNLLKPEASNLRKRIKASGAKSIICVLDENSVSDSRWHSGHELQRENYIYILQKVIEDPSLGVIFKPKTSITLNERMGANIVELLKHAEATGRCFVFRETGRYTTIAPPTLAALASDVTIGCHLDAGTAALEAVLGGIPTILIDREGSPFSILSQKLLPGDVVFPNWDKALSATLEYLKDPQSFKKFGNWDSCIEELDPFRDGLAAKRIGDFLQSLRDGFEKGLNREEIMIKACDAYRNKWGDDKVIFND